ncbi:MAG TPA: outer membrane lipoprotein carrier protein LolA [Candidatus Xenobia bacterium]|nr:outer membrane lipoprotein carrier protein LolA [Candidatus Xenobia bacterium]
MRGERVLLLLCLSSFALSAAETDDAAAAARALERHYNRVSTLEAEFVQRHTLGATTLVESGRVYFRKSGRMRWEYDSPEEKLFLADGEYAYLYVPSEKQVRRQAIKHSPDWQAAFALLLGQVDLKRIFGRLELVEVHHLDSPTRLQLRGRARSPKQPFTEMWFDLNANYQVLRIEIRQRDGGLMEFHFRNWRENLPLSPALFRLSVPPGTVWVDESGP